MTNTGGSNPALRVALELNVPLTMMKKLDDRLEEVLEQLNILTRDETIADLRLSVGYDLWDTENPQISRDTGKGSSFCAPVDYRSSRNVLDIRDFESFSASDKALARHGSKCVTNTCQLSQRCSGTSDLGRTGLTGESP